MEVNLNKIIGHIDMDAFFAAVEERDKPWLKGFPVVVGSDPKGGEGRGVVSTANYKAREYGIHSALPITKAWKYAELARKNGDKQVIFISPKGKKYGEVSKEVFSILENYTKIIQSTSIDEAYFDLSKHRSFKKAEKIAKEIKKEIHRKTKLTCSIGVGPNRMIAKIASDFEKPDGLTLVKENQVLDFLGPLHVGKIPGIGPKMQEKLKQNGIITIYDARKFSFEELCDICGNHGFSLFGKIYGSGSTSFHKKVIRKSIGQHETFNEDTSDMEFVYEELKKMSSNIIEGLKKKGFKGFRTLVLTVRFSDFETKNRSLTGEEPILNYQDLSMRALKMVLPFFDHTENPSKKLIRMVGLRAENLF